MYIYICIYIYICVCVCVCTGIHCGINTVCWWMSFRACASISFSADSISNAYILSGTPVSLIVIAVVYRCSGHFTVYLCCLYVNFHKTTFSLLADTQTAEQVSVRSTMEWTDLDGGLLESSLRFDFFFFCWHNSNTTVKLRLWTRSGKAANKWQIRSDLFFFFYVFARFGMVGSGFVVICVCVCVLYVCVTTTVQSAWREHSRLDCRMHIPWDFSSDCVSSSSLSNEPALVTTLSWTTPLGDGHIIFSALARNVSSAEASASIGTLSGPMLDTLFMSWIRLNYICTWQHSSALH